MRVFVLQHRATLLHNNAVCLLANRTRACYKDENRANHSRNSGTMRIEQSEQNWANKDEAREWVYHFAELVGDEMECLRAATHVHAAACVKCERITPRG